VTAAFIEDAAAVGQRVRAGSDPDHAVLDWRASWLVGHQMMYWPPLMKMTCP